MDRNGAFFDGDRVRVSPLAKDGGEPVALSGEELAHEILRVLESRVGSASFEQWRDRLCFLDAVAVLPTGRSAVSRGFVLTYGVSSDASRVANAEYVNIIKTLVNEDARDVAGHPVFASGLPRFVGRMPGQKRDEQLAPATPNELREVQQNGKLKSVTRRHYIHRFAPVQTEGVEPVAHPEVISPWEIVREEYEHSFGGGRASINDTLTLYASRIGGVGDVFTDRRGRPLATVIGFPIARWEAGSDGLHAVQLGSFFLGTSGDGYQDGLLRALEGALVETVGMRYLLDTMRQIVSGDERYKIAHQTSRTIDSLVEELKELDSETIAAIGEYWMARLYLLQATIATYRRAGAMTDLGAFPLPEADRANPIEAYMRIGMRLGILRAQGSHDPDVRKAGFMNADLREGVGDFDKVMRSLALSAPAPIGASFAKNAVAHTCFAVLASLILRQSFYHTIRALVIERRSKRTITRLSVAVDFDVGQRRLTFKVTNPLPKDDVVDQRAKDEEEFRAMAEAFSGGASTAFTFTTAGPRFNAQLGLFETIITVRGAPAQ